MGETGLYALYRLHQVDSALLEMKHRAAALDGGKALKAEMDCFKAANLEVLSRPAELESRLKALEERSQANTAKLKQLNKALYGGSVVNAKEAAGYEAEIAHLQALNSETELEMLELMEALPAAKQAAAPIEAKLKEYLDAIKKKHQADLAEGARLQAAFKAESAERAKRAAEVPKPLLAQYEAIRTKYGGVGMGVVQAERCGACGTSLPSKVVQALDADRLVTCESCHRILFKVVTNGA